MRHIKQARRADNGEWVRGYFVERFRFSISGRYRVCEIYHTDESKTVRWDVKSGTVEDVAVKPVWDECGWRCPNCKAAYSSGTVKYCADCGQRIDWSGDDAI